MAGPFDKLRMNPYPRFAVLTQPPSQGFPARPAYRRFPSSYSLKEALNRVTEDNIEYVFLNEESISLANAYLKEGVIAENSLSDVRHIAIATVERVDVLVSWNFKHIVNLNRIHLINSVNLKLGYLMLEIRSPMEVIYEG